MAKGEVVRRLREAERRLRHKHRQRIWKRQRRRHLTGSTRSVVRRQTFTWPLSSPAARRRGRPAAHARQRTAVSLSETMRRCKGRRCVALDGSDKLSAGSCVVHRSRTHTVRPARPYQEVVEQHRALRTGQRKDAGPRWTPAGIEKGACAGSKLQERLGLRHEGGGVSKERRRQWLGREEDGEKEKKTEKKRWR